MPRLTRVALGAVVFLLAAPSAFVQSQDATLRPEAATSPSPSVAAIELQVGALDSSDAFWRPLLFGGEAQQWETLADVVNAADLVVLGRPVAVRPGRVQEGAEGPDGNIYGSSKYFLMAIEITRVLAGEAVESSPGLVEVEWSRPRDRSLEEVAAALPVGEESLFFLFNQGRLAHELRLGPDAEAQYARQYTEINDPQGVIRNIDGLARPIGGQEKPEYFPSPFDGKSFDALLAAVERAASGKDS